MCTQVFCADFKQSNPCGSGKWTDHNFGPVPISQLPDSMMSWQQENVSSAYS